MALTLTSAIGPTDRVIAITGTVPDSIEAGYEFRLDDERLTLTTFALVEVEYPGWTQMDPNRNLWMVRRGVGASHDAGTVIQAAVDAYVSADDDAPSPSPFAAGSGSVQTIRRLGPYTVNFDDSGLGDAAIKIADLDTGTIVFAIAVFVEEAWDAANAMTVYVGGPLWAPPDEEVATIGIFTLGVTSAVAGAQGGAVRAADTESQTSIGIVSGVSGALCVYVANTLSSSGGVATVYALIAEAA